MTKGTVPCGNIEGEGGINRAPKALRIHARVWECRGSSRLVEVFSIEGECIYTFARGRDFQWGGFNFWVFGVTADEC